DPSSACKVADKFASASKEKAAIEPGVIEGQISDAAKVNAFAKLPSREELLGRLAAVWMGPVRNFTIGLAALSRKKAE
ncbi:50S ribosomal protein L10, partial [Aliarcobacter butzleri]